MTSQPPVLDYSKPERKPSLVIGCLGMLVGLASVLFTFMTFAAILSAIINQNWTELKWGSMLVPFTAVLWAAAIFLHRFARRDAAMSETRTKS